jgi:hypothetical protein
MHAQRCKVCATRRHPKLKQDALKNMKKLQSLFFDMLRTE